MTVQVILNLFLIILNTNVISVIIKQPNVATLVPINKILKIIGNKIKKLNFLFKYFIPLNPVILSKRNFPNSNFFPFPESVSKHNIFHHRGTETQRVLIFA